MVRRCDVCDAACGTFIAELDLNRKFSNALEGWPGISQNGIGRGRSSATVAVEDCRKELRIGGGGCARSCRAVREVSRVAREVEEGTEPCRTPTDADRWTGATPCCRSCDDGGTKAWCASCTGTEPWRTPTGAGCCTGATPCCQSCGVIGEKGP